MRIFPGSRTERLALLFAALAGLLSSLCWYYLVTWEDTPSIVFVRLSEISKDEKKSLDIFSLLVPEYTGKPYQWGFWDCSLFVKTIYENHFGIEDFPRTADEQCRMTEKVETPSPGDLACFDWDADGKYDHIGIYAGMDHIAHNTPTRGVCFEKINSPWLQKGLLIWKSAPGK